MPYDGSSRWAVDGFERRTVFRRPWLLVLAFMLGAPVAYLAWMRADVTYSAQGNLWIQASAQADTREAPSLQPPDGHAWIQLLRSYRVLEAVVLEHRLHLRVPDEHARAFADFHLAEDFRPGAYELRIGMSGADYALLTEGGALVQRGALGEPVGPGIGFDWAPPLGAFEPGATVRFSVLTPRDAAEALSRELWTAGNGSFLGVGLRGSDPERTAEVVNSLLEELVEVAAELRKRKNDETVHVLETQLAAVEDSLFQAERDLEAYRRTGASSSPEEMRLTRRVRAVENLYGEIRRRAEQARLERAMATPDVRVLDWAPIPDRPAEDTRLPVTIAVLLGFLGMGLSGALLLGRREVSLGPGHRGALRGRVDEGVVPVLAIVVGSALAVLLTALLAS